MPAQRKGSSPTRSNGGAAATPSNSSTLASATALRLQMMANVSENLAGQENGRTPAYDQAIAARLREKAAALDPRAPG